MKDVKKSCSLSCYFVPKQVKTTTTVEKQNFVTAKY